MEVRRGQILPGVCRYKTQIFAIPFDSIPTVIKHVTPFVTALHFVLIDCNGVYNPWDTVRALRYPASLAELHVTFAYTSPPSKLLLDAPRGTFLPATSYSDLPIRCRFNTIKRLVVREANADFVAFLISACRDVERVESTAQFRKEDIPPPSTPFTQGEEAIVFARLPRTTTWPGVTNRGSISVAEDSGQRHRCEICSGGLITALRSDDHELPSEPAASIAQIPVDETPSIPSEATPSISAVKKGGTPIGHLAKRVFRRRT
ncbi:hypothetical protein B0H16DRAFT_1529183 [Mycena metata]|uniref:Uncharacterized protein n=1 Tax=Mycena metata TaxID=1033252 RepID=A0AAD7NJ40_9AGAR|nr:hypothetical protein B0H16DRAFT_1529183 [Mycena metata]